MDGRTAVIGEKIDPATQQVTIDGLPLPIRPELVYYLVNKPRGVVSTVTDPRGRPTVLGLVPEGERIYPVGRLDLDSEGLLIITNDGDLTNLLTHPRYGVEKTYSALVAGHPGRKGMRRLESGVELEDGLARAVRARVLDRSGDQALIEIVMREGRKREVRRMLDALGHPVRRLVRTGIGPVTDPNLASGSWRALTLEEIRQLYSAASWDDEADRPGADP